MNRRQRRAATHSPTPVSARDDAAQDDDDAHNFQLAQPDRSGPKAKTLYEYAAEREAELSSSSAAARTSNADSPVLHALFFGTTLAMLHFTLDVLVYHQYRQEIDWREIVPRALAVTPLLMLSLYLTRGPSFLGSVWLRQACFCVAAVGAGCHLVWSGNNDKYYAVMKNAAPVGTLWVWSVIEMNLWFALPSLLIVAAYTYWHGFNVL